MSNEQETQHRWWFGGRELSALVALAALALAIGIPRTLRSREESRRTSCERNLMQIGQGIQNFHDIRQEICPSYLTIDHSAAALPSGFPTWPALLKPLMEQRGVYDFFDLSVPLDQKAPLPANHEVFLATTVPEYHCPSRGRDFTPVHLGDYGCVSLANAVPGRVVRSGPRTWDAAMLVSRAFNASTVPNTKALREFQPGTLGGREYRSMTTFKSITDGLANTVLIGEKAVTRGHIDGKQIDFAEVVLAREQDGPLYFGRGGDPADLIAPGALAFWSRRLAPMSSERLLPIDPKHEPPNNRFGSWHPGVTLFLFCDGSVRQASNSTSSVVLQSIGCRNDSQSIEQP